MEKNNVILFSDAKKNRLRNSQLNSIDRRNKYPMFATDNSSMALHPVQIIEKSYTPSERTHEIISKRIQLHSSSNQFKFPSFSGCDYKNNIAIDAMYNGFQTIMLSNTIPLHVKEWAIQTIIFSPVYDDVVFALENDIKQLREYLCVHGHKEHKHVVQVFERKINDFNRYLSALNTIKQSYSSTGK